MLICVFHFSFLLLFVPLCSTLHLADLEKHLAVSIACSNKKLSLFAYRRCIIYIPHSPPLETELTRLVDSGKVLILDKSSYSSHWELETPCKYSAASTIKDKSGVGCVSSYRKRKLYINKINIDTVYFNRTFRMMHIYVFSVKKQQSGWTFYWQTVLLLNVCVPTREIRVNMDIC